MLRMPHFVVLMLLHTILVSVLLVPSSAQTICAQQASCSDCIAANQESGILCFWSQPPSSSALPGGSGIACVNQSSFDLARSTSPANVAYGYCPPSFGCDGLALSSCFAKSTCDWFAPYSEIVSHSSTICDDGFCAHRNKIIPPTTVNSVRYYEQSNGVNNYTVTCVVTSTTGISPVAVGFIIVAAILFFVLPLIFCRKYAIDLLATACGCGSCYRLSKQLNTKRRNLVAGEPAFPKQ